jgi:short-subunit dehydrogenase
LTRPRVDGQTALITGASSGIGAEICRGLAGRVSKMVIVARGQVQLEALAVELRAKHRGLIVAVQPCDLSDPDALQRLVTAIPKETGILVNCAGLGDINLFEFSDIVKLRRLIAVNVEAVVALTHAVVPQMLKRGSGGILNISSGFGVTTMPGVATYSGSKHFVSAFSESLRMELSGAGICVTQVCPGPVDTNFEKVAGNLTGRSVPGFVEISAAQCAQEALRGFYRGRAMVVPGRFARWLIALGRITPAWVLRLVYRSFAPELRRYGPPKK